MAEVNVLDCGPIIQGFERDLGLSLETIALAVAVDRRTVERWRANQSVPQGKTRERLAELVTLRDQLLAMFGTAEAARQWLGASSRYLGGFTPLEALRAGRLDRVRADLEGLAAGVYLSLPSQEPFCHPEPRRGPSLRLRMTGEEDSFVLSS